MSDTHQSTAGLTCCFCLGGDTDIPPFGKADDATNFVHPCLRCSLTCHRKCLLDWFNSIPSDKLKSYEPLQGTNSSTNDANTSEQTTVVNDNEVDVEAVNNIINNGNEANIITPEQDWELVLSYFEIRLSGFNFSLLPGSLISSSFPFGSRGIGNSLPPRQNLSNRILLVGQCPQCKGDITFSFKKSYVMGLNMGLKSLISKAVETGCVFSVVLLIATGVISISTLAFTTCGLKIATGIVPGPLLVNLFQKDYVNSLYSTLINASPIAFSLTGVAASNLDEAFAKRMIDSFKFSRIPFLPIILYKMRLSSIIESIMGFKTLQDPVTLNTIFTEVLITAYLSSLGNHRLLFGVVDNLMKGKSILKGVNFMDPNNIVSLLAPIRWGYDLFYRLVINRGHYRLTLQVMPRDIVNTLTPTQLDKLEATTSEIGECELAYKKADLNSTKRSQKFVDSHSSNWLLGTRVTGSLMKSLIYYQTLLKSRLPFRYFWLKCTRWILESKACLENDYSSTFLNSSFSVTSLTTLIWPFLSSRVGSVLAKTLIKFGSTSFPRDQLRLYCNIAGLVLVVLAKDCWNLYLSRKKATQITNMEILKLNTRYNNQEPQERDRFYQPFGFPGGFPI